MSFQKSYFNNNWLLIFAAILIFSLFTGCSSDVEGTTSSPPAEESVTESDAEEEARSQQKEEQEATNNVASESEGTLTVHFIDVGQGDATLIQTPSGKNLLMDAGDNGQGDHVVGYLKALGIDTVDVLIFTHPHADHIGGGPEVIQAFDIGSLYMPKVSHTTQTFERLLLAIEDKGLRIKTAKAEIDLELDPVLETMMIGPRGENYDNLNDYSTSIRIVHGANGLVITGDAERQAELEMVNSGMELMANLLRVAHHGSNSSSIPEFLQAVDPDYGVISAGHDNRYGHPHQEVIQRLQERNIEIYRTDLQGTIIAVSDGENWQFDTHPVTDFSEEWTQEEEKAKVKIDETEDPLVAKPSEEGYIGNVNSDVFHTPDCNSLPAEHNRIYFDNRNEAIEAGQRPCQRCNP
ncbi:MBL fold metallo-hydrolase [Tindallia californiensis]|uniref:Competence protein ComEC n=1 Tax=Tindallia californiensis TaxID=159292 RepID=A0A1H3NVS3_9FIRM|nr:MBL fold metallo-hydrolase [Tindallia californiensis]SDY92958.1 competence protein ComEC [Tindallia californiensis]